MFGAKKTVDIFGFNIYLVETDDIPSAPKGSAVLVKKDTVASLEEGKLVLYLKPDANDTPTLGYVKELSARDGVAYITVAYNGEPYEFSETKLVGRADYSSKFWGGLIGFIKTPLGVMVIAILPCAALILFDIARAATANRPEPEVVPKVKNADEEPPHTDVKLSVDTEGKASYAKDRSLKPLPKDSDVLFNYSGRQKSVPQNIPRSERPIIPLTDKKTRPISKELDPIDNKPLAETAVSAKTTEPLFTRASAKPNPAAIKPEPKAPISVLNSERSSSNKVSERTAEIPELSPKTINDDAFFAQSSVGMKPVPQIGRQRAPQTPSDETQTHSAHAAKPSGKRSTQILASKGLNDLFSDDDDERIPAVRRADDAAVEDILAGLERK